MTDIPLSGRALPLLPRHPVRVGAGIYMAPVASERLAPVVSRASWIGSGERSARRRLGEDLLFALLIVPALAVVLLAMGSDRDRVVGMLIVWTGLGTVVGLVRFWLRSREENRR